MESLATKEQKSLPEKYFYYFWLFLSENYYEARSQPPAEREESCEFRGLLKLAIDARRDAVETFGIIGDQGRLRHHSGWIF